MCNLKFKECSMPKKYIVQLKPDEREQLREITQNGKAAAKTLTHARILLKADCADGHKGWNDETISEAFDVSVATVERVRCTYFSYGLAAALKRNSRTRERARRLNGNQEAHLIALACSEPPTGHEHWALRLLADKMVTLEYVEEVSHETVRRTLKKTNSSRG
jgi:Homeodomain-like domain